MKQVREQVYVIPVANLRLVYIGRCTQVGWQVGRCQLYMCKLKGHGHQEALQDKRQISAITSPNLLSFGASQRLDCVHARVPYEVVGTVGSVGGPILCRDPRRPQAVMLPKPSMTYQYSRVQVEFGVVYVNRRRPVHTHSRVPVDGSPDLVGADRIYCFLFVSRCVAVNELPYESVVDMNQSHDYQSSAIDDIALQGSGRCRLANRISGFATVSKPTD